MFAHEDECKRLQMTGHELPAFVPPSSVVRRAKAIGATFITDQHIPEEVMDPAAAVAKRFNRKKQALEAEVRLAPHS